MGFRGERGSKMLGRGFGEAFDARHPRTLLEKVRSGLNHDSELYS